MSISTILGTALSGLSASQAALRQTANNIANVNTQGYARTEAAAVARNVAGRGLGVSQAEVSRITDRFLLGASLSAGADAAAWQVRSDILDRVQAQFGSLDNPGSVFSRLSKAFADIGVAAQDPASSVRRLQAVGSIRSLMDEFARLDREIRSARSEVQQQINSGIDSINQLLGEINNLNSDITRGKMQGDATGAENRQAALIDELGELVDVRIERNELGAATVRTQNGVLLLGQYALKIEKSSGSNGAPGTNYSRIKATLPSGASVDLQSSLQGGRIYGLLALRDGELAQMSSELAEFANGAAEALNDAHANAIAVPPPSSITGRNTGLLASDASNFTGATTLALVDTDGALMRRVDVDFTAGTLSVDGGATASIGSTIGDLATALNSAFGATASVSFANGSLSLQSAGTNGFGFLQDDNNPSNRAGRSFASVFGLNELVTNANPTNFETGLTATDPHGFTAGETLNYQITTSDGRVAAEISVSISGSSIGDVINSLNDTSSGLGRYETYSLGANGQLLSTPVTGSEGYNIKLSADNTTRVGTDLSFSQIFGVGDAVTSGRTASFKLRQDILRNPDLLSLAKLELSATTAIGDFVAGKGDGRGGFAIQKALETARSFQTAGSLSATSSSLVDFSGRFAVITGSRAANADREAQTARGLSTEADLRRANVEGVNIDEELANMTLFQQSYNAAARLIQAAKELNEVLLRMV
ncbi:MAG: flagellar hook-associated protein FlgK [Robiginitomaculum sp.]|nr:flagellar hook-associated protein FlgK [Robiginitomaculum sp.]